MEIGISTATLFNRAFNEDALAILEQLNARVVEIFLESFCEYSEEYARLLKSRTGGLAVHSVHTLNTHFEPQLFSVNQRAYADAIKIFENVLISAQILGAKNYTLHGLIRFKKGAKFDRFEEYGKYINTMIDLCERYDVSLCLENVEWALYGEVGVFKNIKKFAPRLKGCFDIKQARISGFDYRDYISEMAGNINTVHLSDVDCNGNICLPGKGIIDFRELFLRLCDAGFTGNMLVEVYNDSFGDYRELSDALEMLRNLKQEVFKI